MADPVNKRNRGGAKAQEQEKHDEKQDSKPGGAGKQEKGQESQAKDTTSKAVKSVGEKAAGVVEAAAKGTKEVAGMVKEKVAGAGHKVVEIAGAATGESKENSQAKKSEDDQGKEQTGEEEEWKKEQRGGILSAIGETFFEIAQTAKELVLGKDTTQTKANDKPENKL